MKKSKSVFQILLAISFLCTLIALPFFGMYITDTVGPGMLSFVAVMLSVLVVLLFPLCFESIGIVKSSGVREFFGGVSVIGFLMVLVFALTSRNFQFLSFVLHVLLFLAAIGSYYFFTWIWQKRLKSVAVAPSHNHKKANRPLEVLEKKTFSTRNHKSLLFVCDQPRSQDIYSSVWDALRVHNYTLTLCSSKEIPTDVSEFGAAIVHYTKSFRMPQSLSDVPVILVVSSKRGRLNLPIETNTCRLFELKKWYPHFYLSNLVSELTKRS